MILCALLAVSLLPDVRSKSSGQNGTRENGRAKGFNPQKTVTQFARPILPKRPLHGETDVKKVRL